ncbi:MAG: protein kinase [Leptolyngbyaceae cyanobacterium]
MQPPLPSGTLLQSHYRIVQQLGQGGFGRTYLAEDQNRYGERCAIKEFVPQQGEAHFFTKATELFQREANILYQIQHPQIPQFRETFEVDQRLFLVQDYVEGPSYKDLLYQRRAQNHPFSEAEVRQFLQQMLPVLAHIHAKGIIHRDISPDNVLLRSRDRLPVLIDFGVVKEVVTRMQMLDVTHQATTVGKPGYAPSEQMQSGRAYPCSDLYSLAVTAIVLLTGKEPQDLLDSNLTWHWQQFAAVSPSLAQVLNKAVSYRPGDRYQSVSEMAQALGSANSMAAVPVTPYRPPTPAPSQMRTVAVGRPAQSTTVAAPPPQKPARSARPSVLEDDEGSVWENPWAVAGLAVGIVLVAGLGGWGVVSTLNRNQTQEATSPAPPELTLDPESPTGVTSPEPTPTPTPTQAAPEPVAYDQPLEIRAGESTVVEGNLNANETVNYRLQGQEGQTLLAQLEGQGILMTVLAPNGNPPDSQARRVLGWTGELEFTGEYTLQLSPAEGSEAGNYALTVSLTAPEAPEEDLPEQSEDSDQREEPDNSQEEEPVELEQPEEPDNAQEEEPAEPEIEEPVEEIDRSEQRVRFPAGRDSILYANSVGPGRIRRYVINVQEGQVLEVDLASATGPVTFNVLLPTGDSLSSSQSSLWEGVVPVGGDYAIDVMSSESAEFTLNIGAR